MEPLTITGAHVVLYSSEPDAVREVLRDVFEWRSVDAGDGWLIFALPPAETAVHPAEPSPPGGQRHELALMCDDLASTADQLRLRGLEIPGEPQDRGWGITTTLLLPGGLEVLLYEPRHPTAN
jgi:hypothetical protein